MNETPLQAGDIDRKIRDVAVKLLETHDETVALIRGENDPTSVQSLFVRGFEIQDRQSALFEELRKLVS